MSLEISSRGGKILKEDVDGAEEQSAVKRAHDPLPEEHRAVALTLSPGHTEAGMSGVGGREPVTERSLPSWIRSQNREESYRGQCWDSWRSLKMVCGLDNSFLFMSHFLLLVILLWLCTRMSSLLENRH